MWLTQNEGTIDGKGGMNQRGLNNRYDPLISSLSHNSDEVTKANTEQIYFSDADTPMCSLV